MTPSSLPAHLLRQMLFCPRIPWFMEFAGVHPQGPFWVQHGDQFHAHHALLTRARTLRALGLENAERRFDAPVRSSALGLHGKADLILLTAEECVPVEIKLRKPPRLDAVCAQLASYGLMAEETFGLPCRRLLFLHGPRVRMREIKLDADLRRRARQLAQRLHDLIENTPLLPDSPATPHQCSQCEYLNYCNDRE